MKIDLSKFQKVKEGAKKIQVSQERLAVWNREDRVKFPFSVDQAGEYKITIRARAGKDDKDPYSNSYAFYVDGKKIDVKPVNFGFLNKVFDAVGSNWADYNIFLRLEKGAHSLEVETNDIWLGIESINIDPVKVDTIPTEDFEKLYNEQKKLHIEQKTKADTLEVNYNSLRSRCEKYEEFIKWLTPNGVDAFEKHAKELVEKIKDLT